ncbi:MAG TPA: DoxX family protein [Gemmatimonadaceae bacterium]|jgi:putative oxidoreductase|nr:DoxX family protein [Gemmatimonadaceae bacterium]
MSVFNPATKKQVDTGLAILRVVIGAIFVAHGGQKLFVFGLDGVAGAFGQMGIPMAGILGPFVAFVEFFGGLALVSGLLTRLASLGLLSTMVVAILKVHLPNGFFAPNGIEFPLALIGGTALLALTGAGSLSIDSLIAKKTARSESAPQVGRIRRAA